MGCIVVGSVDDAVLYVPTAAQQSQHCDSCIVRAGEIVGRVLDFEGRPVSEANVYAMKSDHQKGAIPAAETDSDGSFRLAVVPGEYSVYAGKESAGYPEKFGGFYSIIMLPPSQPFTIQVSALGYSNWHYTGDEGTTKTNSIRVGPAETKKLTVSLRPVAAS